MSLNESIVEDAALEWFGELGYAVGHGPHLAPGEPAAERDSFGEVVLTDRNDLDDQLFGQFQRCAESGEKLAIAKKKKPVLSIHDIRGQDRLMLFKENDPACGSGGSLPASRLCGVRFAEKNRAIEQGVVQSEKFVESHGGVAKCEVRSASVEVKNSRPFVIRNSSFAISRADIGKEHADTFRNVQHPDLRADWQIANAEVRMWN